MEIDVLGQAIENYWRKGDDTPVKIWINGHREPDMYPSIFFRKFPSMLGYEKHVMQNVKGKVIDVGCAAGCHAHYLQNKRKLEVLGIETSIRACQVTKERGIQVLNTPWQNAPKMNADHAFALMNGMGLAQSLDELSQLLMKLNSLLKLGGTLWIDSTDVTYAEAYWPIRNKDYFGIVEFKIRYRKIEQVFSWLFVDQETAMKKAREAGFDIMNCRLENNGHYLLQLRKIR